MSTMDKFYLNLKKKYFDKNRTFIIAEIGTNHDQSLKKAKKLILKAKKAGADAVKFQILNFSSQYYGNDYSKKFESFFNKISLPFFWIDILADYCKKKDIIFFASPTFKVGFEKLRSKSKIIKIASPQFATDDILTKHILKSQKTCIVSNGLLTLDQTINKMKKSLKINKNIILLYCISRYPTKINDLNLQNIKYLKKKLNCVVGFSDHTTDTDIPSFAVALGAKVIEKHLTLNKKSEGPDHKFALEPKEFNLMIKKIRFFEKAYGLNKKKLTELDNTIIKSYTPKFITKQKINKNKRLNLKFFDYKRAKGGIPISTDISKFKTIKELKINQKLNRKHLKYE